MISMRFHCLSTRISFGLSLIRPATFDLSLSRQLNSTDGDWSITAFIYRFSTNKRQLKYFIN
jgi:hypothetical protein